MYKATTLKLYNLKQAIDSLPEGDLKEALIQQCEAMHRQLMSACMQANACRHFHLTSPLNRLGSQHVKQHYH